jgi:hypothetical protein
MTFVSVLGSSLSFLPAVFGWRFCHFWVALLSFLGIALSNSPPYNLGKKYGAERGGLTMENELKTIITELLEAVTDVDLLDLIYKLLLIEC